MFISKLLTTESKLYENVGFEAIHSRNNGDLGKNNTLEDRKRF
jgi:hypothetical protein